MVKYVDLVAGIRKSTSLTDNESRSIASSFTLLALYVEDPVDAKGDDIYRLCQSLQFSYVQFIKNFKSVENQITKQQLSNVFYKASWTINRLSEAFEEEYLTVEEFVVGLTHTQSVMAAMNSDILVFSSGAEDNDVRLRDAGRDAMHALMDRTQDLLRKAKTESCTPNYGDNTPVITR